MKKNLLTILSFIFIFFLSNVCFCQEISDNEPGLPKLDKSKPDRDKTDFEKHNLFGCVKSVFEKVFEFNNGNKIFVNSTFNEYTDNGYIKYSTESEPNGSIKYKYIYGKDNNLIKISDDIPDVPYSDYGNYYNEDIEVEYDRDGNLYKIFYYVVETFFYDNNGWKYKVQREYPDADWGEWDLFKYDEYGNIIEKKTVNTILNYKTMEFEQNSDMTIVEIYDERGNVSEKKIEYLDENNISIYFYKYEYDNKGNWLKCIETLNNHPVSSRERLIEYCIN